MSITKTLLLSLGAIASLTASAARPVVLLGRLEKVFKETGTETDSLFCNGWELGPGVVLTAAHCLRIKGVVDKVYAAALDSSNGNPELQKLYEVTEFKFRDAQAEPEAVCADNSSPLDEFRVSGTDVGLAMTADAELTDEMLEQIGTNDAFTPLTAGAQIRMITTQPRSRPAGSQCGAFDGAASIDAVQNSDLKEVAYTLGSRTAFVTHRDATTDGPFAGVVTADFWACKGESGAPLFGQTGKIIGVVSYTERFSKRWWKVTGYKALFKGQERRQGSGKRKISVFAGWTGSRGMRFTVQKAGKAPSRLIPEFGFGDCFTSKNLRSGGDFYEENDDDGSSGDGVGDNTGVSDVHDILVQANAAAIGRLTF